MDIEYHKRISCDIFICMNSKRIAVVGMLLALALILSYLDSLIPMPIPVAGIKLGLANLAVLFALYKLGAPDAIIVSTTRVILTGLMFAGFSGILYSLAGATLSLFVMILLKKITGYHIVTVSACGSLAHITGQLIVAALLTSFSIIVYYAPVLLVSSFIAGIVIGILASSLNKIDRKRDKW
ncbi:MAG: Gx transporter family protein [Lachnospiraceae bacterium]|nr:Gx transporter family protein [Lachnospiraceae bacterium]